MHAIRGAVAPLAAPVIVLVLFTGCTRSVKQAATSGTSTTTALSDADGPIGTPTGVVEVAAGTCFNDVADPTRKPYAVMVVDCPSPHTYEAYDQIRFTGAGSGSNSAGATGKPYPGKEPMRAAAEDACFATFQAWMGVEWKRSDFDIATWWPSAESWPLGDRTILCAVYKAVGGKVAGSVQGSAT